jgi:threonine dehydratase
MIPLLPSTYLLSIDQVLVKDEGRLRTGSFKALGVALAVSIAKELGVANGDANQWECRCGFSRLLLAGWH